MTSTLSDSHAERILIAACLCSIDALNETVDRLTPESFCCGMNGLIFSACQARYLQDKEVDPFSVIGHLGNKLDMEGANAIVELRDYHDPDVKLREYIEKVLEKARLRKILSLSGSMAKSVEQEDSKPESIVGMYVEKLSDVVSGQSKTAKQIQEVAEDFHEGKSFEAYLDEKMERVRAGGSPYVGIKTHYPLLDETLGSLQDGCLHYIGARTSMGKTTFVMNLMANMMRHEPETAIGFMSLEMLNTAITEKFICMGAGVPFTQIANGRLNPEEHLRLVEASNSLSGKLIIDDSPMTIAQLTTRARRMVKVDGIKVLFIDYLTCIKSTDNLNSNHERVNQVSKGLLSLAKELKIPIVCLAQLNRGLTARTDKRPNLSDFRESGSIEEDADVCMLLHRPGYFDSSDTDDTTHLIIAKNRLMGDLRTIKYEWDRSRPGSYKELKNINSIMPSNVGEPSSDKPESYKPYNDR